MKITRFGVLGAVGALSFGATAVVQQAAAQTLMYSFETLYNEKGVPDPTGTRPDGFHFNGGGTTITQDTFGATNGTKSMKFSVVTAETFVGAITELGAPFDIIDTPNTTAITFDYTTRAGEESTANFVNLGITVFGENPGGEGQAQTVVASEQPAKLAPGTYRMVIPLIARFNPFTFDLDVPFHTILGPDATTQMIATSFQIYANKGPPATNGPWTGYFDNIRAIGNPVGSWNADLDGDWSESTNWLGLPTPVPSGVDAIAMFGLGILANRTVNVDSPRTVGSLYFNNGSSYTLAGTNAITLDVSSGQSRIDSHTGSHTVSAPLVLNDDVLITVGSNVSALTPSILTLSGPISAAGRTITKAGTARLDISPLNAAGLTINGGAVMLLAGGGVSRVQNLTIAGGAAPSTKLDITNNPFVVDYTGTSPLATIKAQVVSGFAGGSWNGNGIVSSNAAGTTAFGVGYAEASALTSVPAIFGSVDSTAILLRLTRLGDANLDGTVNLQDFNRLAGSFGASNAVWSQGDFNYDGTVNLQDFNRLAGNFGLSAAGPGVTPEDWAALAAAVPEPASSTLFALCAAALTIRRRRQR